MSQTRLQPMQEILRAIERAAPNPWHYREESEREGFNLEGVEQVLELLHLEGLVTRGTSTGSSGPGVVLTPKGEAIASDPDGIRFNFTPTYVTVGDQFVMSATAELARDLIDALKAQKQQKASKATMRTQLYASGLNDIIQRRLHA